LQVGVEVEVLLHRQVFIEAKALWHVTDAALNLQRLGAGILAEHRDAAAIGKQQAGSQAHERRLAGAVRADEAAHPAVPNAKADLVERLNDAPVACMKGLG
jgi:hypothetical protein